MAFNVPVAVIFDVTAFIVTPDVRLSETGSKQRAAGRPASQRLIDPASPPQGRLDA